MNYIYTYFGLLIHFGGTFCLHLQGRKISECTEKWYGYGEIDSLLEAQSELE
jgi:hypothetical protein